MCRCLKAELSLLKEEVGDFPGDISARLKLHDIKDRKVQNSSKDLLCRLLWPSSSMQKEKIYYTLFLAVLFLKQVRSLVSSPRVASQVGSLPVSVLALTILLMHTAVN